MRNRVHQRGHSAALYHRQLSVWGNVISKEAVKTKDIRKNESVIA